MKNLNPINDIIKPIAAIVIIITLVVTLVAAVRIFTWVEDDGGIPEDVILKAEELIGSNSVEIKAGYDKSINGVLVSGDEEIYAVSASPLAYSKKPVDILAIINKDLSVREVLVLSVATQTPGIGEKVLEPKFLDQFAGANDMSEIDTVSGATYTAKGVINGVEMAINTVKGIINGDIALQAENTEE